MPKKFKRVPADVPASKLSPLNISCQSTKCESGLHCFTAHQKRAEKKFGQQRTCHECGSSLDTWDRMHKKDIRNSKLVFEELEKELIRHVYFHMPIKVADREKAAKEGLAKIRERTIKRLTTNIGVAKPFRGGITPYDGDVIFYGQHATASCCRKCMEVWHGIPQGRQLTQAEVEYLAALVMTYISRRCPELKELPLESQSLSRITG